MDTPKASVPYLTVPVVRCTEGHPLAGLFLVLRPQMPQDGVIDKLFEVDHASFSLALTDPSGRLQLCTEGDPWPAWYAQGSSAHAMKILADVPYELYAIRHPDPALARQALRELNRVDTRSLTRDWRPTLRRFEIRSAQTPDGTSVDDLVLSLDESPAAYHPRGSERYGGWTLYADMPCAHCAPVRAQVRKLQADFGKLRFIVGGQNPYVAEPANVVRGKLTNPYTANDGLFDSRTLNATYVFQRMASDGDGFRVMNGAAVFARSGAGESWETSLDHLRPAVPQLTIPRIPLRTDGVVNAATGAAIGDWLTDGIRQSGRIMVQLRARELTSPDWYVWVGVEAARSLYAWRELTKALGFANGIQANATYRGILVDVGHAAYGRSARSIHKVALAVDTGLKGSYHEVDDHWPIVYSREKPVPKISKGELVGHRIYWRLYAPSTCIPSSAAGIEACRQRLAKAAEDPSPLAFGELHAAATQLGILLDLDPKDFLETFYKPQVEGWSYDAWDDNGGTPLPAMAPREWATPQAERLGQQAAQLDAGNAALQERIDALKALGKALTKSQQGELKNLRGSLAQGREKARVARAQSADFARHALTEGFVDLTAIGETVDLMRIGSFTNMLLPTGSDWGLAGRTLATKSWKLLASALAQAKLDLPVRTLRVGSRTIPFADVDTEFMSAWGERWAAAKALQSAAPALVAALSREKTGRKKLGDLRAALDAFPDKTFRRRETGELKTGAEWSAELQRRQDETDATAPAKLKDRSQVSAAKRKADWTYTMWPTFGVPSEGATEPIEFAPRSSVVVPAPGSPIGMEWWHFQRTDLLKGKTYGRMLEELGWTRLTASDQRSETLYHRRGAGYPESELDEMAG